MIVHSSSEQETIDFARKLTKILKAGDILFLEGDLGAGKTTFVKGLAEGLGIAKKKVTSPTFVLLNIYEGRLPIYHFDLYRLEGVEEISLIGYEEFLYGDGVAAVEWAERLGSLKPREYFRLQLSHQKNGSRKLKLSAVGSNYKKRLLSYENSCA